MNRLQGYDEVEREVNNGGNFVVSTNGWPQSLICSLIFINYIHPFQKMMFGREEIDLYCVIGREGLFVRLDTVAEGEEGDVCADGGGDEREGGGR
ncbi:hypothetical protein LINPERHAP1_LOCUS13332, partial [Linum perenne]